MLDLFLPIALALQALTVPQAPSVLMVEPTDNGVAAYRNLPVRSCGERTIAPEEAIRIAADLAPRAALTGCFELVVRRAGFDHNDLFLDSEEDYRDQRSLNVRVTGRAADQLQQMLGNVAVAAALVGRPIAVRGSAYRQRIDFTANGQPTGKYYYQTHLYVSDVGQITRPGPPS